MQRITTFAGARAQPRDAEVRAFPCGSACLDWLAVQDSVACETQADKERAPALALATWREGSPDRTWENLAPGATTDVLAFDLDQMTRTELRDAFRRWRALDAFVHATWKHTKKAPRFRLFVSLDSPLTLTDKAVYKRVYAAAAQALGLKHDTQTSSPSNLFFLPQHKPDAGPGPRLRLRGVPLELAKLPVAAAPVDLETSGAAGLRPSKAELKKLAERWRKRGSETARDAGHALAAVLDKRRYAQAGSVYGVTQQLAYQLAFVAGLDEPWFRGEWLEPTWRVMWPGEELDPIETDWSNAWRSALERAAAVRAERAEERAKVAPAVPDAVPDEVLERVTARQRTRSLVCLLGQNQYYVYDPYGDAYYRPVASAGLGARMRDTYAGIDQVRVMSFDDNGVRFRPPSELMLDYGCTIKGVSLWAKPPPEGAYTNEGEGSVRLHAYTWNDFSAERSEIADDLLRSMGGDTYPTLEAWLTKFRRLERPIPALVLVGPPGVWKSKTAQILSRFWGDRSAPSACRASQVLGRFSDPLLLNPVVWSDEHLARDERGRAQPERYRESISEVSHRVEPKGVAPVILHTALRHVISVNDLDLVFSREVEGDAVRATMERFLVITIDGARMAAFEARWAGTPELDALREGTPLLSHVQWLERECAVPDVGRFGIETHTDPDVLARAQFANDTLTLVLQVATDALLREAAASVPGQAGRCPIRIDGKRLRFVPRVLVELWADARATRGFRGSAPTVASVQRTLEGAGFREVSGDGGPGGFVLSWPRYQQWLRLSELYEVPEVAAAIRACSTASLSS